VFAPSIKRILASGGFHFCHYDIPNHWLAVGNKTPLAIWQLGDQGQFHLLQSRFDASQTISANQNLMLCKDQPKTLFLFLALEFGESKFVMGQ
jgi:hypothetical protein